MLQDLRFAMRLLNRERGYAAMAILTFALGVGANTAVFSVADSVLFRPLPFVDAGRLFALRLADTSTGTVYGTLPAAAVEAASATGMLDGVASASTRAWRAYVRTGSGLDAWSLSPVSRNYLDLLGVRPLLGRTFDASDTGSRAVLLTHSAWRQRYGGDAGIVGRAVPAILRPTERAPLAQPPLHIIGVLPPRLRLPLVSGADGIVLDDEAVTGPDRMFAPLVRLAPGVTAAAASARLRTIRASDEDAGGTLRLVPLREELALRQDPVLWLLLAAAGIVLLVACVNLANLTMARGSARLRELAIRASLGSSRQRLVRLLLAEAMCVAGAGTLLGLAAGYWGVRGLTAALPPLLAGVTDPRFDTRVFVFALAIATTAAALFAVAPALRLSRADARDGLRPAFHAAAIRPRRGRQALVGVEIAVCVMLVVGAMLVGRTLVALATQDLGFAPHRLAVSFDLPTMVVERDGALRTDTAARSAFYRARLDEVRRVPGVRAAALASGTPFSGIMPDAPLLAGKGDTGGVYGVSSGYFASMGIALLAGRDLTDAESFAAAPAGVLNLTAARRLCGTPAACIGTVVQSPRQAARTVVGVVADVRPSLQRAQTAIMYVPFLSRFALKTLVIAADDTAAATERIKSALSVSPDARVDLRSLDAAVDQELSPYRFNAVVVGGFALLTLLLAMVGVYGVMAAVVGERMREFGVRLALGATPARVNRHVLGLAAAPTGAGVAAGLLLAAWASRFVTGLLYGVVAVDAASFVAAAAVLSASGILAALIPARRAGRVDPMTALRAE